MDAIKMDPREAFALELGRVNRRWRARLDERLRATGLTQARWVALLQIVRAGEGVTQRELAERVGIEGPTLVRILDALEHQGLIERCPVQGDRRAKQIRLTKVAQPVLTEINRIVNEVRREILVDVSRDELAACLEVLRRIGDRLDKP